MRVISELPVADFVKLMAPRLNAFDREKASLAADLEQWLAEDPAIDAVADDLKERVGR
jgi:hypothetical protein